MHQSSQHEEAIPASISATGGKSDRGGVLDQAELASALQLLVERAQYITGATGTALALPQGAEMVCRASTGSCAPAVGARLQVRSGLTGESIASRRLLRCDNAESDPRVNLQACRALGIASIIVLPLMRPTGELRALFELFSDHPYAFEERDLLALERMADLTLTALDLAEERQSGVPSQGLADTPARQLQTSAGIAADSAEKGLADKDRAEPDRTEGKRTDKNRAEQYPAERDFAENDLFVKRPTEKAADAPPPPNIILASREITLIPDAPILSVPVPPASIPSESEVVEARSSDGRQADVPQAADRIRKCEACGFPVSEGRTLCIDCEQKAGKNKPSEIRQSEDTQIAQHQNDDKQSVNLASETGKNLSSNEAALLDIHRSASPTSELPGLATNDILPPFLANAAPVKESWLANHVGLLVTLVIVLGVVVAYIVFH
ncbi:MAG: GAF domain-containing protein [Terriglobales bacterium]